MKMFLYFYVHSMTRSAGLSCAILFFVAYFVVYLAFLLLLHLVNSYCLILKFKSFAGALLVLKRISSAYVAGILLKM